MLKAIVANLKHPRDKEGRYQFVNLGVPEFAAVLSNTPKVFRNMRLPRVMAERLTETVQDQSDTDPKNICRLAIDSLDRFTRVIEDRRGPLIEEEFDVRSNMGGEFACVARSGSQWAVARVGEYRIVAVTPDGVEVLLTENTYLAELRSLGLVESIEHPDRNIITAALGGEFLPITMINNSIPESAKWILAGSSEILDYLPTNPAEILNMGNIEEALNVIVEEVRMNWGKTAKDRRCSAILAVEI